jgi:uncharacterized membrane protein YczE
MTKLGNLPLRYRPVRRLAALYAGLVLYGGSMSLMIAARLGLDPWDVLNQGISRQIGVRFGYIVIGVGAIVLLLWIPLRQRLGIGTISNVLVIGLSVDAINDVLPVPSSLALRWVYGIGGIVACGVATGLYIGTRFGPGPRDGLMTGVVARFPGRWFASIRLIRTAIEVTVLVIGFVLGGTVGWITLFYALLIGPIAHVTIPLFTFADPPVVEPAPELAAVH